MSAYLRPRLLGATIFGAVALCDRGSSLLVDGLKRLRDAMRTTRAEPWRRSRSRAERGRAGRPPEVLPAQPGEARVAAAPEDWPWSSVHRARARDLVDRP